MVKVISVRENPEYANVAIVYIQSKWPAMPGVVYQDCINHSLSAPTHLPQWYLLENEGEIIGCAGLVTNDFISRMELYPWVCALHVEKRYRGNAYGSLLLERAKADTKKAGFDRLYLATDYVGLYEKYGFDYIGQGYHPWGEESRIYAAGLNEDEAEFRFCIRPVEEKEYPVVYDLIKTAFETAKVKDGDEQDFAERLRKGGNYIPGLELIAVQDEKLIGHVMLTELDVTQSDGSKYKALLLAPLSVLMEYRNKGVGASLIWEACRLADEMGYGAIFLCGDPAYYVHFGFMPTTSYGISNAQGFPDENVMVCELKPGALKGISGVIDFS